MNIFWRKKILFNIAVAVLSLAHVRAADEIIQLPPFVVEATSLDFAFATAWEDTTQELRDYVNDQIDDYLDRGYKIVGLSSATGNVTGIPHKSTGLTPEQELQMIQERMWKLTQFVNCLLAQNPNSKMKAPLVGGQTAEEAKQAAFGAIQYLAEQTNFAWEWGAMVYQTPDGTHGYTLPVTQRSLTSVDYELDSFPSPSENKLVGLVHSHPQLHVIVTQQGGNPIVIADQFSAQDRAGSHMRRSIEATRWNLPLEESPFKFSAVITEKPGTDDKYAQSYDPSTGHASPLGQFSAFPSNC